MSFLGAEELLPPQRLLLAKERAPDPDNVFGAAACGHPRVEVRRCGKRERVHSEPRDTRTEETNPQKFGVPLLTREAINVFGPWKTSRTAAAPKTAARLLPKPRVRDTIRRAARSLDIYKGSPPAYVHGAAGREVTPAVVEYLHRA
jgi:hypothetical protein